jgi:hypothetical protein
MKMKKIMKGLNNGKWRKENGNNNMKINKSSKIENERMKIMSISKEK